jgi:hypothetical protein
MTAFVDAKRGAADRDESAGRCGHAAVTATSATVPPVMR